MRRGSRFTRRDFVKTGAALSGAGLVTPYWLTGAARAEPAGTNLRFGAIGVNGRGFDLVEQAIRGGAQLMAIADVDSQPAEQRKQQTGGKADLYVDYRKLLDRKDIDFVTIGTPDHWHTKIALEAMHAGKDVYCEKPLTLTIDEGKLLRKAVKDSGRVFQVGTQQRSEYGSNFLTAVALCRAGRVGDIQRITCAIGNADSGGPFKEQEPPAHLDWDFWLGPAPKVPYMPERCHFKFRWWYDYSGGQVTDWGVHHVDIAHWAMGATDTGPVAIEGTGEFPKIPLGYETAVKFNIKCNFRSGVELLIVNAVPEFDNGVLIEGTQGRLFVNRGKLTGRPVEALAEAPLPEGALLKLCKGKQPGSHMGNFMECIKDHGEPVSDVASHHRSITTCHLANIAIRLGRPIRWDPDSEQIIGDDEANAWQKRKQRSPYQFQVSS